MNTVALTPAPAPSGGAGPLRARSSSTELPEFIEGIAMTEIATTTAADGRGWVRPKLGAEQRLRRRNRFVAHQMFAQAWRNLGSGLEWLLNAALVVWLYQSYGQPAAVAAGLLLGLSLIGGRPLVTWLRWRRDRAVQHSETVLDGLAVLAIEGGSGPAWDLPWRQEVGRPVEPALVWLQTGWDGGLPRPYAGHTGSPYLAVVPELCEGTYTGLWLAMHTPTGLLLGNRGAGMEFLVLGEAIGRVSKLDWSDPDPEAYRGASYGVAAAPARQVWDQAVWDALTPWWASATPAAGTPSRGKRAALDAGGRCGDEGGTPEVVPDTDNCGSCGRPVDLTQPHYALCGHVEQQRDGAVTVLDTQVIEYRHPQCRPAGRNRHWTGQDAVDPQTAKDPGTEDKGQA